MRENLHNLNNCPESRVAVKEVNENKKARKEVIKDVANRTLEEEKTYGVVNGTDTVNRTEATKALYKVADEIVSWGVSTHPTDKNYTKMKPKQAKAIWEDVCLVKGYNLSDTFVIPKTIKVYVSGTVTLEGKQVTKTDYVEGLNRIAKDRGIYCTFLITTLNNYDYVICGEVNNSCVCEKAVASKIYNCEEFINKLDHNFLKIEKVVNIERLFGAHNDLVAHSFDWEPKREKDMLEGSGVTPKEFDELWRGYGRITEAKGLCSQMEWLHLALDYLRDSTDCLAYLEEKIDTVLRYKFSMDLPMERKLVKALSRACRDTDKHKNVSVVDTLFSIDKDSNKILHLVPTARHMHEVYEMPFDTGIGKLEYMSVITLEDCLTNGETLEGYKSVCYFRGKLPESCAINLMHTVNRNRVDKGLDILGVFGIDCFVRDFYGHGEESYVTRFMDLDLGVTGALKLAEKEARDRNSLFVDCGVKCVMNIEHYNERVGTLERLKFVIGIPSDYKITEEDQRALDVVARLGRNTGIQLALVTNKPNIERYYNYLCSRGVYGVELLDLISCQFEDKLIGNKDADMLLARAVNNVVPATEKELKTVMGMFKEFEGEI